MLSSEQDGLSVGREPNKKIFISSFSEDDAKISDLDWLPKKAGAINNSIEVVLLE